MQQWRQWRKGVDECGLPSLSPLCDVGFGWVGVRVEVCASLLSYLAICTQPEEGFGGSVMFCAGRLPSTRRWAHVAFGANACRVRMFTTRRVNRKSNFLAIEVPETRNAINYRSVNRGAEFLFFCCGSKFYTLVATVTKHGDISLHASLDLTNRHTLIG